MGHVVWPPRNQVTMWTILILVIALAVAYFLDVADLLFGEAIQGVVGEIETSPLTLPEVTEGGFDLQEAIDSIDIEAAIEASAEAEEVSQ